MPSVLTLTEAAALLKGKASLATLHRHSKEGILSYSKNPKGTKIVHLSELERVYGPLKNGDSSVSHENPSQEKMKENENPDNTAVVDVLREQVALLTSQLETANHEKAQVLKILENQTLMLPKPAEPEKKKRSWFGYFRLRR